MSKKPVVRHIAQPTTNSRADRLRFQAELHGEIVEPQARMSVQVGTLAPMQLNATGVSLTINAGESQSATTEDLVALNYSLPALRAAMAVTITVTISTPKTHSQKPVHRLLRFLVDGGFTCRII